MKKMVLAVLLAVAIPAVASASLKNGIGGGLEMVGSHPAITLKARALSVTPLELQYTYVPAMGQEANINLYLLYTKYFKLHFIDPGVYIGTPLGVNIGQKYDISLGGGIEITIWKRLVIFANARVYLPDPTTASNLISNQTEQAGVNAATQTNDPNQIYNNAKGAAYNSVDNIYGAALKNYRLSFGAMWFFW
jgi:hypothetical protein